MVEGGSTTTVNVRLFQLSTESNVMETGFAGTRTTKPCTRVFPD